MIFEAEVPEDTIVLPEIEFPKIDDVLGEEEIKPEAINITLKNLNNDNGDDVKINFLGKIKVYKDGEQL